MQREKKPVDRTLLFQEKYSARSTITRREIIAWPLIKIESKVICKLRVMKDWYILQNDLTVFPRGLACARTIIVPLGKFGRVGHRTWQSLLNT
jgi:hypothetical protein